MSEHSCLLDPECRLREVVERAYSTFARYKKVSDFVGCACGTCVSAEENAAIHAKPLRDLAPSDLSPLMSSAWVDTDDLKHFLPRLLDWVASGQPPDGYKADRHAALATLTHYGEGWTRWPQDEQRVIREFVKAWWMAVLQREIEPAQGDPATEGAGYHCPGPAPSSTHGRGEPPERGNRRSA